MSAKAMELMSRQREGARVRRADRLEQYLADREAARVEGLRIRAALRFQHNFALVFGFSCFLFVQVLTVVYTGWYLFPAVFG